MNSKKLAGVLSTSDMVEDHHHARRLSAVTGSLDNKNRNVVDEYRRRHIKTINQIAKFEQQQIIKQNERFYQRITKTGSSISPLKQPNMGAPRLSKDKILRARRSSVILNNERMLHKIVKVKSVYSNIGPES